MCVFDDGYPEYCSFPLVLYYGRFLGDDHTVDVTVVDVYGQTLQLTFDFNVEQRKLFTLDYPSTDYSLIQLQQFQVLLLIWL